MKQVGYRSFHATKRLNNGPKEDEDDDGERSDEKLRSLVFEIVNGVYFLGMKGSTLQNLVSEFPAFYRYLAKNFQNELQNCRCYVQRRNDLTKSIPYVMLPDENMTIISWDGKPKLHGSEDLKRSLEKI